MAARTKHLSGPLLLALLFLLVASPPSYSKEEAGGLDELSSLGVELLEEPTPAPRFSLPSLEGGKVSLGSLKDRLVMLHFWTTWSPSATTELKDLERLQKSLAGEPFTLITIAADLAGEPRVRAFLAENSASVPVLLDPEGEVIERYDVRVVPTTIFIDPRGRVIGRAVGPRYWGASSAINALKKIVKAPDHYGIITSGLPAKPAERSR